MTEQELTKFFQDLEVMKNTNVTTSLERIKLLRNALSEHGKELDLTLVGGRTQLTDQDSSLETVVREYNKIIKRLTPDVRDNILIEDPEVPKLIVDSTSTVYVQSGYYSKDFIVKGAVSSEVAAELAKLKQDIIAKATPAQDVVAGAKAIEVITNVDGTLTLNEVNGEVGSAEHPLQKSGISESNNLIVSTSTGKDLLTNIPAITNQVVEAKITVIPNATVGNENIDIIETTDLQQGYYDGVSIRPVLEVGESNNKIINVSTNTEIIITHAGNTNLVPDAGFDYIKSGVIKVGEGSSSVATTINGNQIILTPSHSEGWIAESPNITGSNVVKNNDGSYTLSLPTVEGDGNAIVTISPDNKVSAKPGEGYYDGNTSIPLMFGESGKEIQVVHNPNTSINLDPEFNNQESKYIVNIIEGKNPTLFTGPLNVELDASSLSINQNLPENATVSKNVAVNNSEFYIISSKGYTEGEVQKVKVEDGGSIELTTEKDEQGFDKIVVKLDKSGWVNAQSTDVTQKFLGYADLLIDSSANGDTDGDGIIDESKGTGNEISAVAGQALFTYGNNLDEAVNGVQEKTPAEGSRYFTSAKVDLSALIREMDII